MIDTEIRKLEARRDELSKARVQLEAETVLRGISPVGVSIVRNYAMDLPSLIEEADLTERKPFLR